MIDGSIVKMGGKEWVVPALSFGQLKRLMPKIQTLVTFNPATADESQMDDMMEIVHAALSRNYPDLKIDEVFDLIDVRNAGEVVMAVMGQSGLASKQGEA